MATGELKVRAVYTRGLMSMMTLSWQTVGNTFEQTGCPAALLFQEMIVLYLHCSQRVVDVFWAPSVWVSARQACVRSHELWEGTQPRPSLVCVCSVCEGECMWSGWEVCATKVSQPSTCTSGPDYQKNGILPCSLPKHKTNSDCKWTTKIHIFKKKQLLNVVQPPLGCSG